MAARHRLRTVPREQYAAVIAMNILGLASFYHDSSACLVQNGAVIAAAQEERFNRKKNTEVFPLESINYCLQAGGILPQDIDYIAYFEKPFLKFSRVMQNHLDQWPFSFKNFVDKMPLWLQERLSLDDVAYNELGYDGKILYLKHHLSHAASAFLPSDFDEAAIMTVDGVGEWSTLTVGHGHGQQIKTLRELHYPHSLGLLYTAVTAFLGFGAHGEEGKTMGLAGFGEPRFAETFREILKQNTDGSLRADMRYFSFQKSNRMWSGLWEKKFGPPRGGHEVFSQHHKDIAASLQLITEEYLIRIARLLQEETGSKNLCMAGGVTLNCIANSKILEQTGFENIFVQPAAGDAGGSLGAALYASHCLFKEPRPRHRIFNPYLGPVANEREIERTLLRHQISFKKIDDDVEFVDVIAQKIAAGDIVGWFQGQLEFGPRALGHRSIFANPCQPAIKEKLNSKIKNREIFQPFAPIVSEERASEFFDLSVPSPYMLLAPRVKPSVREKIPAVVHIDGTARVQTTSPYVDPKTQSLLARMEHYIGVPILLNTSFNGRGEPIVAVPEDAVLCFKKNKLDVLAIGNFICVQDNS